MPIQVPNNFTPRDYQLKFLEAMDGTFTSKGELVPGTKKYRAILRWHRRSGKDTTCFCYMVKEAFRVKGNYYYIFPTKEEARKALWENFNRGWKILDYIPK